MRYITDYYKSLFGDPGPSNVCLEESVNGDIPKLTNQENNILITDFTEKEVHEAIMQMEKNKAPGPDGFQAEF